MKMNIVDACRRLEIQHLAECLENVWGNFHIIIIVQPIRRYVLKHIKIHDDSCFLSPNNRGLF